MVCGNAEGCIGLMPVVVGKSKKPRALKDYMHKLPVEYHNNPSAWFKQDIVSDWFHNVFDPEVRKH
ncbi:Uncharacterized protein FKW44_022610 [Caligus rogercresseyi]|uniref:DDE-1 domain-containing protein n=1 Tax=Caligus rogercresseyi TaxID=217165 RepID=A0A7T8GND0_CALRO|nr:Uncharacterized protein FKW44_022610 [Caligus rogercresseyi]